MHQVPELTGTQRLGRQDMELASTSRGPEPFPPCPHQQGALAVPRSVHKGAAWHPVPDFTPYLLESHAQDSPTKVLPILHYRFHAQVYKGEYKAQGGEAMTQGHTSGQGQPWDSNPARLQS